MAADDVPGPRKQPRFKGTGAPATAADLNIVSDHAALVGNRKIGTTSERTAAVTAGEVWPGMLWRDTTLKRELIYVDSTTGFVTVLEDTGWQALTLQNGWANFGGAYANALIRRLNGVVHTTGLIKDGAQGIGTLVAQAPVGFRPAAVQQKVIWANGQARQLDVYPNGDIKVGDTAVSFARTSLDMTWPAEQ